MRSQLRTWSLELEQLRQELLVSFPPGTSDDLEEELQACLESLDQSLGAPRLLETFASRRSVDLLHRGYIETDSCCIVRRTNEALLFLLSLNPETAIVGMPLLIFIDKVDRPRFTTLFLQLRTRKLIAAKDVFFRMRPLPPLPPY